MIKKKSKLLLKSRGTQDILPAKALLYQKIQQICQNILNNSGYKPIILPTYEYENLFTDSLGEATDIIQKEMFVFPDRKNRSLALRPEGTAGVVRLVCQNKLINPGYPNRLYYWGNMFRYERPQKDRYREFTQLGVELINAQGLIADGELFWLVKQIILAFQLKEDTIFHWNYLGSNETKKEYKKILKNYLADKLDLLCSDCSKRYTNNPLRILDCKICHVLNFPPYTKILKINDLNYIKELNNYLNILNIKHNYNQCLVRGLDYYTGIVFELSFLKVSSQGVILGGGRYDQLFQRLGEINLPAAGFALGVDRLANYLLSSKFEANSHNPDILFLLLDDSTLSLAFDWREELSQKYQVVCNLEVKKTKNIFKNINYHNPLLAIIISPKNISDKKVLVKDCQKKKEFLIDEINLIEWVFHYLKRSSN